jgi:protein-L-isoaspartate(D-aspartate) O-methyltransferase
LNKRKGRTVTDFAARRTIMVDTQVRPSDVTKFPIIESMLHVPRELFVPPGREEAAYMGENLALGGDRVLLEPRTFAKMLDGLDIAPTDRVLHVAAGLGYGSAVMARLGGHVTALEEPERVPGLQAALASWAAQDRSGAASPIAVAAGPLAQGVPGAAPASFDAILVEGAVEVLPERIEALLAPGGRMAAIFLEGALGGVRIGHEIGGRVHWRLAFHAGAPVLSGFHRAAAFVL